MDIIIGVLLYLVIYTLIIVGEIFYPNQQTPCLGMCPSNEYVMPMIIAIHLLPLVTKKMYIFLGAMFLIIFSIGGLYIFYGFHTMINS